MRQTDKFLKSEKFKQVVGGLGVPLGKSPVADQIRSPRDPDRSFPCWPGSGWRPPGVCCAQLRGHAPSNCGSPDRDSPADIETDACLNHDHRRQAPQSVMPGGHATARMPLACDAADPQLSVSVKVCHKAPAQTSPEANAAAAPPPHRAPPRLKRRHVRRRIIAVAPLTHPFRHRQR